MSGDPLGRPGPYLPKTGNMRKIQIRKIPGQVLRKGQDDYNKGRCGFSVNSIRHDEKNAYILQSKHPLDKASGL
ncbi:hypothetical protein Dsin_018387 [Dipteronia sinensis]|uniref:Uncharacterized protein n=1 Tax=Dipteronia sinensis TaxID=43782 RepID=A0AAE0E206_9ROSI|nr:hypothetical protein Dsin_018387 [Dipteronia sinensis]